MKQNVVVEHQGRKIKVQFDHCPKCWYFDSCYKDGINGRFMDPDCLKGPGRRSNAK